MVRVGQLQMAPLAPEQRCHRPVRRLPIQVARMHTIRTFQLERIRWNRCPQAIPNKNAYTGVILKSCDELLMLFVKIICTFLGLDREARLLACFCWALVG
jgi:hypothetical protein